MGTLDSAAQDSFISFLNLNLHFTVLTSAFVIKIRIYLQNR